MELFRDFDVKRVIRYFFLVISSLPIRGYHRYHFLKLAGLKIKGKCYRYKNVTFDTVHPELIHIGENVTITEGTKILTHYLDPNSKGRIFRIGEVFIEDDVFIGVNTIICNSVRIGKGAIVGAGSVVTKDIPPYQVWAGNPARFIKERAH